MAKFPILAAALTLGSLLSPAHAQTYTVIHDLQKGEVVSWATNLSQSPGGYLLCSLSAPIPGMDFELGTGGWFHPLHTFTGPDGVVPASGLILGTDQRFHGTTANGGKHNHGTVYRLSPDGKIVIEHNFAGGKDGEEPISFPIQSVSGDWYGVTSAMKSTSQGRADRGSVYTISAGGNYTLLHSFTGPDGAMPYGPLVEGSDGLFYGTTVVGGANNLGTIFTISRNGAFKVLHNFDVAHGWGPGSLIQARDGNFYGVAGSSSTGAGVIFRITPDGTYTVVHYFDGKQGGKGPSAALLEATDGNFYGTTTSGGASGAGILYRLTPAGVFTKLFDFDAPTGSVPVGTLLQHTDGKFYGHTFWGGANNSGVIFKYDLGLTPFVTYLPIDGRPGVKVTILGQDFQNNSIVRFNGTQAQVEDIHPTYLKAFVPDGATTGPITVQTSKSGQTLTFKSNKPFVVH